MLAENETFALNYNLSEKEIEKIAFQYIKEFNYTKNHVSIYKNKVFSITTYKNSYSFANLSLSSKEIGFGVCYEKVKITIN